MKLIWQNIRLYVTELDKKVLILTVLLTAIAVFTNYYWGLNKAILSLTPNLQFLCWTLVFLLCFTGAYGIQALCNQEPYFRDRGFLSLLVISSLLFAWKMAATYHFTFHNDTALNNYWNRVSYWPFKVVMVTALLWIVWRVSGRQDNFYGVQLKGFHAKPYWIMLLLMVPLVVAAATQPDFQEVYPKLQHVMQINDHPDAAWMMFLYELSYGSDFFTIELFSGASWYWHSRNTRVRELFCRWPFFIAPFTLANRWANAFRLFWRYHPGSSCLPHTQHFRRFAGSCRHCLDDGSRGMVILKTAGL